MGRYDFIAAYMLANHKRGTIYVGVASDLPLRVWQHRCGRGALFTTAYRVTRLVWFERHERMEPALRRERRLKEWKRAWKIALIEQDNPEWRDVSDALI